MTTATMTFPLAQKQRGIPLFDWTFVVTGGLLFSLPFVFWMGEQGLSRNDTIRWYFWVNALISAPHVYATYIRVQRKITEQKISWWLGFPSYFLIAALLAVTAQFGFLLEALTLVNVWQSYHYLRQTYGVSCIYNRKYDRRSPGGHHYFWPYHLIMPVLILGRWDTLYHVWGGRASNAIIPVNFSDLLLHGLWIVAAGGFCYGLWIEYAKFIGDRKSYHPIGFINLMIYLGIHVFGFTSETHYQRGFFAVTIFHAVQYLGLVWILERKNTMMNFAKRLSRLPNVPGFLIFWMILFSLGYSWEIYLAAFLNHYWIMASAILLAAVSAHHYLVDSFIWNKHAGP